MALGSSYRWYMSTHKRRSNGICCQISPGIGTACVRGSAACSAVAIIIITHCCSSFVVRCCLQCPSLIISKISLLLHQCLDTYYYDLASSLSRVPLPPLHCIMPCVHYSFLSNALDNVAVACCSWVVVPVPYGVFIYCHNNKLENRPLRARMMFDYHYYRFYL